MREALAIYTELGIAEGQLDAVEGLAQMDILEGDPGNGLRLLAVAGREGSALGAPIFTPDEAADRERAEAEARSRLGTAEVARAYRESAATTLSEAVAGLLAGWVRPASAFFGFSSAACRIVFGTGEPRTHQEK